MKIKMMKTVTETTLEKLDRRHTQKTLQRWKNQRRQMTRGAKAAQLDILALNTHSDR